MSLTDPASVRYNDVNDVERIMEISRKNEEVDELPPRGRGQRRRHIHLGLRQG